MYAIRSYYALSDSALISNSKAFCEEIRNNPDVIGTGLSTSVPGRPVGIQVMKIEGENGEMIEKAINNFFVNFDYVNMMGFEIVKGRGYSRDFMSDPGKGFLVNEAAVREYGVITSYSIHYTKLYDHIVQDILDRSVLFG